MTGTSTAFQTFVQYAGVILQLLYFLAMIVLGVVAIFAVRLYKRHVDFITGAKTTPPTQEESVSVEDFVD